jgi:glycosyltransferase involved in cell wall biosynthesis
MSNDTLHFFSYDSMGNPWLGGGGSLRDQEILRRYKKKFSKIILYVGAYPNCFNKEEAGIEIRHLGMDMHPNNEWSSRIFYILKANRILKQPLGGLVGANISPYSPYWNIFRHKNMYGILHHHVGSKWNEKAPFIGKLLHYLEYNYYKRFSNVVTINSATTALIKKLNPSANIFISANACDSSLFSLIDRSSDTDPFILYFGRMDRFMKGLDLLIEAFNTAYLTTQSHRLVLAGRLDHKQSTTINAIISQYPQCPIEIVPNPTDSQRAELLSRCSFFCSPSRFEGWGIAALEACAAGKPVVVSKAEGFIDSISPEAGVHVDIDEPNALANTLITWINNPQLIETKKSASRKWAQNFTWDSIAEKEQTWFKQSSLL